MSKRYRALIVVLHSETAKVDNLFSYLGTINLKEFGEHQACSLKITSVDYSLQTSGENRGKILVAIECVEIDLATLEGKHRYADYNKFFEPSELKEVPNA